jgi:hypothetical protein
MVGSDYNVGIWARVAVLRSSKYQPQSIPVQHGMVGIHVPSGGVYNLHDDDGKRITFYFFQSARDSMHFPLHSRFSHPKTDFLKRQVFSTAVTLLWIMVACGTIKRAYTGDMFFAPCLKDLEGKEAQAELNCPVLAPV